MNDWVVLASLLGALLPGVLSPGPSFLMVAQTSAALSRQAGIAAALGMGMAATLLAVLALLGLHTVLAGSAALTGALQLLGGLYLLYLARQIWRAAALPLALQEAAPSSEQAIAATRMQCFGKAFATMLSNPKATIQYGVIFAALLPAQLSLRLSLAVPVLIFALEAGWYLVVAMLLSAARPRAAYLRHKRRIDRVAAAVLLLLGLKLILGAGLAQLAQTQACLYG